MIGTMHTRFVGTVLALCTAALATSHSAFAQQADSGWFDGSAESDSVSADEAAQGAVPSAPPAPPENAGPAGPTAPPPTDDAPETDPRAMTEFRPTLDPYGTWVDDEKYGTVWVPNRDAVGSDFAPYVSAGHWTLTEEGDWYWQSDYPFGNVVFHYGRWVWVPGTGWAWVAGRRYANAWVTWRVPTDEYAYVGWAPMPPAWGWYGGSAISLWWYPPAPYVFCPSGYAFSYHVNSYIVHDRYVIHDVAAHTRGYPYYSGGVQHVAASPRAYPANSAPPRGPTLQSAHIPASAAPASRIASRPASANARMNESFRNNPSYGGARPATAYSGSRNVYSNPSSYSRPAYNGSSTYRAQPAYAGSATYRAQPAYNGSSTYRAQPSAPQRYAPISAQRYSEPSRTYVAPQRYSAPAQHYSAPAQHYSAPAAHYSAPAVHYSAPATHYSAPSPAHFSSPHFSHSRR